MIVALLAFGIAAVWTLLAGSVGYGFGRTFGRAAARADADARRQFERELRRRGYAGPVHVVSVPRSAAGAHEPVVNEQPDELRARRNL